LAEKAGPRPPWKTAGTGRRHSRIETQTVSCVTGSEIAVRVTPRAHVDEIVGERDAVLRVRVRAPPVDDRANTALCRLLAERVGVRARSVTVVRGAHSRDKVVHVDGLRDDHLVRALAPPR
jgi:uncharacterized protein